MDKNSPDWKKYKQDQADMLKRHQDALDKKHNIGRYADTKNPPNPPNPPHGRPYKKGQKPQKAKPYSNMNV